MGHRMSMKIGKWVYEFEQDLETGEMAVLGHKPVIGFVQKAAEYVKAEASRALGPTSLPVQGQRREACGGCESCKKADDANWYCKSCGCPEWERSRLQVKWEMPAATCPLGKWKG